MDKIRINKVTEALGYEPDVTVIENAMARWQSFDVKVLRSTLRKNVTKFNTFGGRDVVLADEIDSLRIAIAARQKGRK